MSPRVASWLVTLALATVLALQAVHGWQRLQASLLVAQVQREGQDLARRGRAPAGMLARSLESLRRARALDPVSIEAVAAHGDLLLLMGRRESAEATYREALRLEPRSEVYFNLGLALWGSGRQLEALEAFSRAVVADPRLRRQLPDEARKRLTGGGRREPLRPLLHDGFESGDAGAWSRPPES